MWKLGKGNPQNYNPKILFAYCAVKILYHENFHEYGNFQWLWVLLQEQLNIQMWASDSSEAKDTETLVSLCEELAIKTAEESKQYKQATCHCGYT